MRPLLLLLLSPSALAFIDAAYSIPSGRHVTTLPLKTSKGDNDTGFRINIREAKFSDLSEVSRMVSDGFFHEEGQDNSIMRWIRPIIELDRLQTSYTYKIMESDSGSIDHHLFLVAHDGEDNKVVGFCDVDGRGGYGVAKSSLLPWVKSGKVVRRPQPYISDLVVSPDRRRCGLASRLLDEAERRAQDWGFKEMFLCIRRTNDVALQMYSKRGYNTIEPSEKDMLDFLEAQEDLIMLSRSLG
jgi:ribosomal protein S18 acetylase RimI-like enzyme